MDVIIDCMTKLTEVSHPKCSPGPPDAITMFTVSQEERGLGKYRTVVWLNNPPAYVALGQEDDERINSQQTLRQGDLPQRDSPLHSPLQFLTELICPAQQLCIRQSPRCCRCCEAHRKTDDCWWLLGPFWSVTSER